MRFSIIIPSYNQPLFVEETLQNVVDLKKWCHLHDVELEIILIDNESQQDVQLIIEKYKSDIDIIKIEKDNGQFDAINKGLKLITGDYWTWLNTDDLIDINGFALLKAHLINNTVDYIYGDIETIDVEGNSLGKGSSGKITLHSLTQKDASISQPGSFFKTSFTKTIGNLSPFQFAFDYEYILRILKNNGRIHKLDTTVAKFRYYEQSKSGSKDARFLKEQLKIAKQYGCHSFSKLNMMLRLRILKRTLVN